MTRFRLRYQTTDLELPPGQFVIGRSSASHLCLDDALVSRKHVVLHVSEDEINLEDLGSRNGVIVNGERVRGPLELNHLDRLVVGSQEMLIMEAGRESQRARPDRKTMSGTTMELELPGSEPEEVTRQATGFELIVSIANKSLALGRYEEAERLLANHLARMLEKASRGTAPTEEALRTATIYALHLAGGLKKHSWVDWVLDVHAAARTVPTAQAVDVMHKLVREIAYSDARALRRYLKSMAPARDKLAAADRFVLRRLEGLEQVVSA